MNFMPFMRTQYLLGSASFFVAACGIVEKNPVTTVAQTEASNSAKSRETEQLDLRLTVELRSAEHFQRSMTLFIGSHFQSCAPLIFPNVRPADSIRTYWGKKESYTKENSCRDRRSADLSYLSFGVGSLDPDAGHLQMKDGKIDAFGRFNCSGFIAATLASGGLKYYEGQTSRALSPTTREIADLLDRSDTCFFKPTISRKKSLLPGDIINISHGHAIRVLAVGGDPLGLNSVEKKSDCSKISKKSFDFRFAHSTSNNKSKSFSGIIVEEAKNASTSIVDRLASRLQILCRESFDSGLSGKIDDVKVGTKKYGVPPFEIERSMIFSLRRHYGADKANCVFKKPEIIGEGCISQQCFDAVR